MSSPGSVVSRGSGLAAAFVLIACWSNAQPNNVTMPVGNQPMAQNGPSPLEGDYWCSFAFPQDSDMKGYEYPNFPCTIRKDGPKLVLAKLAGSQRINGEVMPGNGGFHFEGLFFCDSGHQCDEPVQADFRDMGGNFKGTLSGKDRGTNYIVTLTRTQPGAFGGGGYGGGMYGGGMYGGGMYGGRSYGRNGFHKPHHR